MNEPSTPSKKLQWKWVGISLVLYALFYLLPLMILARSDGPLGFVWIFTGIIIIAAVAGYLSEGITIVEPAIAGAGLIFLLFVVMMFLVPPRGKILEATMPMVITIAGVFLLSLLGAWMGERGAEVVEDKT